MRTSGARTAKITPATIAEVANVLVTEKVDEARDG